MKNQRKSVLLRWTPARKPARNVLPVRVPERRPMDVLPVVPPDREALLFSDQWPWPHPWLQGTLSQSEEEWLAERTKHAVLVLRCCVEVNPQKLGGVPVLKGTRFSIAQLFAEIGEGRSLQQIAVDFELDLKMMQEVMGGFSIYLDRPISR